MKKYILAICILGTLCSSCENNQEKIRNVEDWTQYVEPRIGTAHCRWFHFTPGALPFGLAKPAPSTNGSLGDGKPRGMTIVRTPLKDFPVYMSFRLEVSC